MDIVVGLIFLVVYFVVCTISFYASEKYARVELFQPSINKKFLSFVVVAMQTALLSLFIGKYLPMFLQSKGSVLFILALCILLFGPILVGFAMAEKYPNSGSAAFLATFISPWIAVFLFVISENLDIG